MSGNGNNGTLTNTPRFDVDGFFDFGDNTDVVMMRIHVSEAALADIEYFRLTFMDASLDYIAHWKIYKEDIVADVDNFVVMDATWTELSPSFDLRLLICAFKFKHRLLLMLILAVQFLRNLNQLAIHLDIINYGLLSYMIMKNKNHFLRRWKMKVLFMEMEALI